MPLKPLLIMRATPIDGENFVHMMRDKTIDIQHRLTKSLEEKVKKNRERLAPIIPAVILCGRQKIALRGHRDCGLIEVDKEDDKNPGNFRALLKYRAKCDEKLGTILEGPGKRDKYISAGIQRAKSSAVSTISF